MFLSKDELFGSHHCPSSKHRNLSGSEGHADATWDHKNRIILYSIPPLPKSTGALELRKYSNLDYTVHERFLS